MRTTGLLIWCGIAYAILLVLVRGAIPEGSSPSLVLVGLPLIVIAVIISRDLARRSTGPTAAPAAPPRSSLKEDPVLFLSGQIRVAADASDSYFENVVRARLRELLTSKVCVELGSERDATRRALSDPEKGPKLLRSEKLYEILYGQAPEAGSDRLTMIKNAIEMIGEWQR